MIFMFLNSVMLIVSLTRVHYGGLRVDPRVVVNLSMNYGIVVVAMQPALKGKHAMSLKGVKVLTDW